MRGLVATYQGAVFDGVLSIACLAALAKAMARIVGPSTANQSAEDVSRQTARWVDWIHARAGAEAQVFTFAQAF
ncbi:hypothetical protein AMJ85_05570 [candidate division BRC1 bacterium SM23_51]|nr:MAG: hypothetical protein AMJ85_05570 [candidate division BRC1 bacterium SM23_51]